jgi:hypothetical protein
MKDLTRLALNKPGFQGRVPAWTDQAIETLSRRPIYN